MKLISNKSKDTPISEKLMEFIESDLNKLMQRDKSISFNLYKYPTSNF